MRNKFSGYCMVCSKYVPADTGYFQRIAGRWKVRCKACVGKGNVPEPVSENSKYPPRGE